MSGTSFSGRGGGRRKRLLDRGESLILGLEIVPHKKAQPTQQKEGTDVVLETKGVCREQKGKKVSYQAERTIHFREGKREATTSTRKTRGTEEWGSSSF